MNFRTFHYQGRFQTKIKNQVINFIFQHSDQYSRQHFLHRLLTGLLCFRRIEFSLQLEKKWTAFTDLSCIENQDVSFKSLQLLDLLTLPSQQPLSDVFKASRNLVATYFNCLRRIFNNSEIQGLTSFLRLFIDYLRV